MIQSKIQECHGLIRYFIKPLCRRSKKWDVMDAYHLHPLGGFRVIKRDLEYAEAARFCDYLNRAFNDKKPEPKYENYVTDAIQASS